MSILNDSIKEFLLKQKLGYVATVSSDGSPNLSPKGTIFVWDDTHLVFANIRSPKTMMNLETNSKLEINVVDPLSRKGYRFRGQGKILGKSELYEKILSFYRDLGIKSTISGIVLISVTSVDELTSPLYDIGLSEEEICKIWRERLLSD